MNVVQRWFQSVFALISGTVLAMSLFGSALASAPCNPPNVIPQSVCDMDTFHSAPPGEVPDGWTEFILSGNPSYASDSDTFFGPPSLRIRIFDGGFKAGIRTQVNVQPGAGYRASVAWGAPNTPDTFGRQLGLDPTGGVDPNSPSVIWGPMHWGAGRMLNYPPPDVNIDVRARATGDVMTVFFLVDHIENPGDNLIFIDAISLYPDESAPAVEIPPTDTPTPIPEVVQAAAPPTSTPVPPTPTPEPTSTPVPSATPTPTETSTATPTITPSPSATPTWTPWPTVPSDSTGFDWTSTSDTLIDSASTVHPEMLIMLGVFGFGGAGLFGGSLLFLRRRR